MNAFLNYIIEANIGLLFFLACYKLLLRKETDFGLLRVFMLVGIFVSLIFPLFHFEGEQNPSPVSMSQAIPSHWLPEVVVEGHAKDQPQAVSLSFWKYTTGFYLVGLILFALVIFFQLGQLMRIIRQAKTYHLQNLHIAESKEDKPTFSFFNFIFIGRADTLSTTEKQQIIRHESVHARRWHSFDILLLNLLKIFFWFNPFISHYRRTLAQLHEFEADARAVEKSDMNKYCSLLAKVALQSADFKLANHFSNSLTVKRIEMMRTIKNHIHPWKMAAMAFLIPVSFFVISCQDQVGSAVSDEGGQETDKEIFVVVERAPSFGGGVSDLVKYLGENIVYPEKARKAGEEGTVYVEFVVNEAGAVSDAKVIRGVHPDLDAEAVRAIKTLPSWTPGTQNGVAVKHRYVLPISFDSDTQEIQQESISSSLYKMHVTYKKTHMNGKTVIEGMVLSQETDSPLLGANIVIQGTSKGTTAGADGRFRLEIPAEKGHLVLSFVGYEFEKIDF